MGHQQKVILITGTSSGIGKECAEYLTAKGHMVYGTSLESMKNCIFKNVIMDVNNEVSIQKGVQNIISREKKIDVVINNAGGGIAGSVEDTPMEEIVKLFNVNLFGVIRVCKAVLPHMRQQRDGLIINISSIGGLMGLPFQGIYSSTKFAVEGISEAMRMELKPFNVKVVLIEPGEMRTEFTKRRQNYVKDYIDQFNKAFPAIEKSEIKAASPRVIAEVISKVIAAKNPKVRYLKGGLEEELSTVLKRIIPSKMFERIIGGYYGV